MSGHLCGRTSPTYRAAGRARAGVCVYVVATPAGVGLLAVVVVCGGGRFVAVGVAAASVDMVLFCAVVGSTMCLVLYYMGFARNLLRDQSSLVGVSALRGVCLCCG